MNEKTKVIEASFTFNALPRAIKAVKWAAGKDKSRQALYKTMCLEVTPEGEVTAVATNGCALAAFPLTEYVTKWMEAGEEFLRAGTARLIFQITDLQDLQEKVKGAGPVTMVVHRSKSVANGYWGEGVEVTFETAFEAIPVQIVDAGYPNWRSVIPKDTQFSFMVTDAIREGFKGCETSIKAHQKVLPNDYVMMEFKDEEITMYPSARPNWFHKAAAGQMDYMPKEFSLLVSMTHMGPLLKAMPGGLLCRLINSNSPVIFEGDNGQMAVYMPCRQRNN